MATPVERMTERNRARGIRVAGMAIILLSAGAALLPVGKGISSDVIGALAGRDRADRGDRRLAAARSAGPGDGGGRVTVLAGLLFLINPETKFFPTVVPIIGWLLIRCVILGIAASRVHGSVRRWMAFSAAVDLLLAILLIAGLSISAVIVSVFGPTPPLIASFAWIVAASFVTTGLMLLEVASCEDEGAS